MSDDIEAKMERTRVIERARLEKGWTKRQLAEKAGYDEKTLYNLLSGGEVQDRTVFEFCQALGIAVPAVAKKLEVAEDRLGGYSRSIYSEYEGSYRIYRPSFSRPDRIYRYAMDIAWDEAGSGFTFVAWYKVDPKEPTGFKAHRGPVSISAVTNLVHFVVTFRGSVRLVTVTKMRTVDGIMRGSMATHVEDLNFFRPTLSPIIIRKADEAHGAPTGIGLIDDSDAEWDFASEQLALTEKSVLNLCFRMAR